MEKEKATIKCPNCGHEIDVNQILYHQLQEQISREYNAKFAAQKREYESKAQVLSKERLSP